MLVGITYDLRDDYLKMGYSEEETAEFDKEETIEGIDNAIKKMGYETERIGNIKSLINKLATGKKWDVIFNICEGMYGISREAQVPALLEAYNIPYVFSDPMVMALTLHKGMTKRVIRDGNIPTADFSLVEKIEDIETIKMEYPLFVKPVAEGTGKGVSGKSKVRNKEELVEICVELLKKYKQPVLVEKYLPGREFTVGVVGTGKNAKIIGMMEIEFLNNPESDIYSYSNKENYLERIKYKNVPDKEIYYKCSKVALDSWKILNCRDGGRIDLRMDEKGVPNFIEVNPLAGLNPIHSDLPILSKMNGIKYDELIEIIFKSAISRKERDKHGY